MQVPSGDTIGRGASKHVVLVLPDPRRSKHAIPEVQLGFSKPGMAAEGFVLKGRRVRQQVAIVAFLLTKLIAGRQQQWLADLKIVLPFNPVTGCFNLGNSFPESSREGPRSSSDNIPEECSKITAEIVSRPG